MKNYSINIKDAKNAISEEKRKLLLKKIEDYVYIQNAVKSRHFLDNELFRQKYKALYGIGRLNNGNPSGVEQYFELMDRLAQNDEPCSFENIFIKLKIKTAKKYVSYASKMLHTLDVNYPIWDSVMVSLKNFNINNDHLNWSDEDCIKAYDIYCRLFNEFSSSDDGKLIVDFFDELFPDYKEEISKTKKIDFILWQNR